jgi:hypothetical protein
MDDALKSDRVRLQIAETLDAIADFDGWNDELFTNFTDLVKQIGEDDLVWRAQEELIHYSGEFTSYNIFFQRVGPDRGRVDEYKRILRSIAQALRAGKTLAAWDSVENAGAYQLGDFTRWLKSLFSKQSGS